MQSKLKKVFSYLKKENRLLVFTLGFLVVFSFGTYAFADALYHPGDTTDPTCGPTDPGCYVDVLPDQTGADGYVLESVGGVATWVNAPVGGDIASVNGDATSVQTISTGTSGTDFAIVDDDAGGHTFNLPVASATNTGKLSSTDWSNFNAKLSGALSSGDLFVGNSSNVAADVPLSGDAALSSSGALTIQSNAVTTSKIANGAVTVAKLANLAAVSLLGNPTGSSAAPEAITLGTGLSFSGTTLSSAAAGTIGTIDTAPSKSANGLTLSGGILYAQTADGTYPGLVSTSTQTFAGAKTFNGIITASGGLSAGGNTISNVGAPLLSTDATNKAYVDGLASGLKWKQTARVATTVAGTLASSFANGSTIDGVTLSTGDRILIKNQASQTENGVYTVNASGAPTRATDANTGDALVDAAIAISAGTTNMNTAWIQTTTATITIGTSNIVFVAFLNNTYSAGAGLTLTGNAFSVNLSTLTGSVSAANGGTGLTSYGSANQLLGMNNAGTALEYKTLSTSGTAVSNDVGVTLSGAGAIVLNLPSASGSVRGVLSSTDWTTFNGKLSNALSSGDIFVGNGSNVATDVSLSGDASISSSGALTIQSNAITAGKISAGAVTLAKLANLSASSLLGNPTGSSATPEAITLGSGLSFSGTTLTATGGASAINALTSATGNGTLDNTNKTLAWDWSNLGSSTGLSMTASSLSSGTLLSLSSNYTHLSTNSTLLNVAFNGGGNAKSYAAQISNANTGGVNVGLSLSASGGSANFALVSPSGYFGINTIAPTGPLSVTPFEYGTGTATQSGTTITGIGTTFTSAMVTGQFVYASGANAGTILSVNSTTSLTVTTSATISSPQAFTIGYAGLQVAANGNVGVNTTTPLAPLDLGGLSGPKLLIYGSGGSTGYLSGLGVNLGTTPNSMGFFVGHNANFSIDVANASEAFPYTSGYTSRFTLLNTGQVGIGTVAPISKLELADSQAATSTSVGYFVNTSTSTSTDVLHLGIGLAATNDASGNHFIGFYGSSTATTTGTLIGSITGIGAGSGVAYNTSSDARIKQNIIPTALGLDALMQIHVKDFNFIGSSETEQGFIAQDLEKVYPYAVTTNGDDGTDPLTPGANPWSVDYGRVTPLLVQSIQDLDLKIEPLTSIDPNINGSLASLIMQFLSNAVITIKDATVGTLHVGSSSKPTGITIYDTVTGQPYCLSIANGAQVSTQGECGTAPAQQQAPQTGGGSTVTPPPADSGDSTATSTPPADDTASTSTPPAGGDDSTVTPPADGSGDAVTPPQAPSDDDSGTATSTDS